MGAEVKTYLKNIGVNFVTHKHPAVYTCEEAKRLCGDIPGIHSKNLLLKGKKTEKFWLIILPEYKRLDLKFLETKFKEKLSFANEEDLKRVLGIKAGAVSAFSLINDKENTVDLILDKEILDSSIVSFHPNVNTETLELSKADFKKYLNNLKNKIEII